MSTITEIFRQAKPTTRRSKPLQNVNEVNVEVVEKNSAENARATLKAFDLEGAYGPCLGITRLERWERADKYGLHPPPNVRDLLLLRKNEEEQLSVWHKYDL